MNINKELTYSKLSRRYQLLYETGISSIAEELSGMDDKDCSFLEDLLPWSEKLPAGIRKA